MFASNNSSSATPLTTAGDARKTKKGFLPMLPRRKSLDKKASKRPTTTTTTTTTTAAFQSGTMVFPEQEDEAYPYLSRRRGRVGAEEGGQFVRRGHAASYEHELQLRDEGVVEYAVRRRLLETTMGARREDVLDEVYAR